MTIRRETPPLTRALAILGVALLGGGVAVLGWEAVHRSESAHREAERSRLEHEQKALKADKRQLSEDMAALRAKAADYEGRIAEAKARDASNAQERDRLSAQISAARSQTRVEQATVVNLTKQLRSIEAENIRLKSDLIYLETLLPSSGAEGVIEIRRLQVVPDAQPNNYRYRALLMQGGRNVAEFTGNLQLLVALTHDGRKSTLVIPKRSDTDNAAAMKVSFKRYSRVEGRFELPAGAKVRSVQLRVLNRGAVRAQQSVTP
ncbi:MAG: hypothetical protein H6934_10070 [Burkholderiaceae bacterium]|nr:hypothetical protein [Burkholderiaceae bacterium]